MSATSTPTPPTFRHYALAAHRWLSLGAAIFWLLQAITGVLIVFHWEITDAGIAGRAVPTDLAAIERRIDTIAPTGGGTVIQSFWTTGSNSDRYNLTTKNAAGDSRVWRIAGDGMPLKLSRGDEPTVMGWLVGFHHDLLGGWGSWIVAISGVLLCTNLTIGIVTAWPRRGTWRQALRPATRGPVAARLYSWHRALGLWIAIPGLLIALTGTLMKFEDGLGDLIGAPSVALPANPPTGEAVGFAAATDAALAAIPGSTLTAVSWPKPDDATYRVRVRAPGEIRHRYGASVVLVDANTGMVRGAYPIAEAEPTRAFMSALFPIHTGEAGGTPGRLLSIAIGLWLIVMIMVGTLLWAKRRRVRRRRSA